MDAATELFNILDDIEAIDDVCMEDDQLFRIMVMHKIEQRFKYFNTDGVKLYSRGD